ncbi:hypothetical protein C3L33_11016, partial [Rhododendron williamsianum]
MGESMSSDEAQSVVTEFDKDGDNLLEFAEFVKLMERESEGKMMILGGLSRCLKLKRVVVAYAKRAAASFESLGEREICSTKPVYERKDVESSKVLVLDDISGAKIANSTLAKTESEGEI